MRSDRREYLVVGFTSIVALSTLYAMYKLNKENKKKKAQYSPIIIEDHRQIADGLTDLIGGMGAVYFGTSLYSPQATHL